VPLLPAKTLYKKTASFKRPAADRSGVVSQGDPGQGFDRGGGAWTLGGHNGPAPVGAAIAIGRSG